MRGAFDDMEFQPAEPRHDTELTLSSTTLLLIFFGLVLLCGLCFGLGYATGHRGASDAVQVPGCRARRWRTAHRPRNPRSSQHLRVP
jgi:hypothetical protein